MKKIILAAGLLIGFISCGSESTKAEDASDSTNVGDANRSPMGDTANQINSNTGNYPYDSSNRNGDDSVSGTNPASRSTTPGNDSGNRGRKQ